VRGAALALAVLLLASGLEAAGGGVRRTPRTEPGEGPDLDLHQEATNSLPELFPAEGETRRLGLEAFLMGLPLEPDGTRLLTRDLVVRRVLIDHLRIRVAGRRYLVAEAEAEEEEARFDVSVFGRVLRGESSLPSANAFVQPFVLDDRDDLLEVGVSKAFQQGLQLSTSFLATRYETSLTSAGLRPEYDTGLAVTAVQPLLSGAGKVSNAAELEAARRAAEAAERRYGAEAALVSAATEILYWRLVGTVDILRLRQESVERVRKLLEDTRARLEAGVVPISEVRQAQSGLAGREEDLTRARREVERVVDTLATNLRLEGDVKVWELPVRTEPLPREAVALGDLGPLIEEAVRRRKELQAAGLDAEAERIEARAARKDMLPRLDLVAGLELVGLAGGAVELPNFQPPPDTVRSPFDGAFPDSLDRMVSGDTFDWSIGLRVSYPVGNRGPKARYARETYEAHEAELERARLEDQVRHEVVSAYKDQAAALERAGVASRFAELAELALEDEEVRLEEGLSNNLRILQLQEDLTDARTRHIEALVEIQRAGVQLDYAVGHYLESRGLSVGDVPLPTLH